MSAKCHKPTCWRACLASRARARSSPRLTSEAAGGKPGPEFGHAAYNEGSNLLGWAPSISWIGIGIRGRVSALQAHLVGEGARRARQEGVFVEFDSALWFGVDLDHPSLDPIGIELPIDSTVERVGEVDATSMATNLYHLGSAI